MYCGRPCIAVAMFLDVVLGCCFGMLFWDVGDRRSPLLAACCVEGLEEVFWRINSRQCNRVDIFIW